MRLRAIVRPRRAATWLARAGVDLAITASVGVASSLDHEGGAAALVRAADDALLRAKSRGRDRVEIG